MQHPVRLPGVSRLLSATAYTCCKQAGNAGVHGMHRPHGISGVTFANGGSEVVASYVAEQIYSFDAVAHARDQGSLPAASRSS